MIMNNANKRCKIARSTVIFLDCDQSFNFLPFCYYKRLKVFLVFATFAIIFWSIFWFVCIAFGLHNWARINDRSLSLISSKSSNVHSANHL